MATPQVHTRRYHQVNRAIFNSGAAVGLVGFVFIVAGLSTDATVGAALGFIGVMTAWFAGRNLVCEKKCTSD